MGLIYYEIGIGILDYLYLFICKCDSTVHGMKILLFRLGEEGYNQQRRP